MIPTPKFVIGQEVFYGTTIDHSADLPCPDCKDTKQWTVTTPAGESFTVACQRCSGGYRRSDLPSLTQRVWSPSVRLLTIGQIKIETPVETSWGDRESVHYMCRETGVGSGSVYRESQLFATEDEARTIATMEANRQTAEWGAKPEPTAQREIAEVRLSEAFGEQARKTIWSVCYHAKQLRETVEGWMERDSDFGASSDQVDAIASALRDLEWHDQQNPLTTLIDAALAADSDVLDAAVAPFVFKRLAKADGQP